MLEHHRMFSAHQSVRGTPLVIQLSPNAYFLGNEHVSTDYSALNAPSVIRSKMLNILAFLQRQHPT
ncbi:hypothetical protein PISMIDRAFT_675644 [Pisolithus microcarpus 441]|uniref:Uncharacterized protein n=1 Tax=Pisolithus microcarpus 441 TaxID=765257 RepID=A0A0C9ZBR7_9AGAM|nr:hypothetical protein PISMIDRAFT_675644 [Pisolithus microcarpus 441]